jgi:acetyltransferase-like isoleucine patch superfamily enzyme
MSFLSSQNLRKIGFASIGENVLISEKASIYGAERIEIGDNVRIDDFCIISAGTRGMQIGSYVHIACYTSLIGREHIRLGDYANLSSRVSVYSSSDDYSGEWMTSPMVPSEFTHVDHRSVCIGRHCIVGVGAVILPGVTLGDGCAIGALALVKQDCESFGIYAGVPATLIKHRAQRLLELEEMHRIKII